MAANNFTIYFADGGDQGTGPYTVQVRKNPTTLPAGGTLLSMPGPGVTAASTTLGGAGQNLGIQELTQFAKQVIVNTNAAVFDQDLLLDGSGNVQN